MYREYAEKLKMLAKGKDRYCIAIDGKCGSGKTTFSTFVAEYLDADLVHIDHFYLPFKDRAENWGEIPAGNMDFDRLEKSVLIPFTKGKAGTYYRFNQFAQEPAEEYTLAGKNILIIDGSYSMHPRMCKYYDYCIFLTCTPDSQNARLKKREGDHFNVFENIWIQKELFYHKECHIKERADLVIDTTDLF